LLDIEDEQHVAKRTLPTNYREPEIMEPSAALELVDYRRRVADLYRGVRVQGVDESSWDSWRKQREHLLVTHPQSPLNDNGDVQRPPEYFPYDSTWQIIASIEPWSGAGEASLAEGESTFDRIGTAQFSHKGADFSLGVYKLNSYGSGLFIPFRDETNGGETYGGGRYILDTAKSADFGRQSDQPEDSLLLDFNFAYHPSCVWDPQWQCPLAPPANELSVKVAAGERKPSETPSERHGGRCERCQAWVPDGSAHDCC